MWLCLIKPMFKRTKNLRRLKILLLKISDIGQIQLRNMESLEINENKIFSCLSASMQQFVITHGPLKSGVSIVTFN